MIKGLHCYYNEDNEAELYCNEKMFRDRLVIEVDNIIFGEGHVETWLTVYHLNCVSKIELDAISFTLYSGDLLAPIQTYRMVNYPTLKSGSLKKALS